MAVCRWCGRSIQDYSHHCPYCGQLFEREVPCERCGLPVPVELRMCSNCGHFMDIPLEWEEQTQPSEAAAGEVPPPPRESDDSISAWPVSLPDKPRELYREGWRRERYTARADLWYYATFSYSLINLFAVWIPRWNLVMAIVTLVLAAVGYFRRYKHGKKYDGFILNIIGSVLGVVALLLSIFVEIQL